MIVSFMSDFGLEDNYVGVVKGAILRDAPDATIVDVTHSIPRHNIEIAAYILKNSYKYFPVGTIHLVVVDPGVGSNRNILIVEYDKHTFVLPDNGIVSVFPLTDENSAIYKYPFTLNHAVQTFHGRDVFAPLVGRLVSGDIFFNELERIKTENIVEFDFSHPAAEGGGIKGKVILIDHFGNVITNLPYSLFEKRTPKSVELKGNKLPIKFVPNYSEGPKNEVVGVFSSFDTFELAVNHSSAASAMSAKEGDDIKVLF